VVAIASVLISGCLEREETQSVSWYKEHKSERAEMLRRCSDNPGELKETPNCQNAVAAEAQLSTGSIHPVKFKEFKW